MSKKEVIARQYDYGCWARDKLLQEARHLSEDDYLAEPEFGGLRSVHNLLLHTMGAEWLWRNLAQSGSLPGPRPNPADYATLAAVEAAWHEEEAAFRTFLDGLDEADLLRKIDTVSPAGQAYTFVRWEMIQHMLLHGVQHRTETAAVLTNYGHSPGDLDFVFYIAGRE